MQPPFENVTPNFKIAAPSPASCLRTWHASYLPLKIVCRPFPHFPYELDLPQVILCMTPHFVKRGHDTTKTRNRRFVFYIVLK